MQTFLEQGALRYTEIENDLGERLERVVATRLTDLLPTLAPPDSLPVLREQARRLFEVVPRKSPVLTSKWSNARAGTVS